jgi:hypothetical protein
MISGSGSPSRFSKPGGNTTFAPSSSTRRPAASSRSTVASIRGWYMLSPARSSSVSRTPSFEYTALK